MHLCGAQLHTRAPPRVERALMHPNHRGRCEAERRRWCFAPRLRAARRFARAFLRAFARARAAEVRAPFGATAPTTGTAAGATATELSEPPPDPTPSSPPLARVEAEPPPTEDG